MLHTCNKSGHNKYIVYYYIIFEHALKEICSLLEYILVTHVEHVELWPVNLLLPRTSARGPAVVFADFPFAFTAMCPLITITHLLPRRGIRVDTGFGEEEQVHRCEYLNTERAALCLGSACNCTQYLTETDKQKMCTNMFETVRLQMINKKIGI